jgi:tetratricopeptide (TPR) repeat protein
LANSIVSIVAGKIERDALVAAKKKKPADMYAYDCLLRGLEYHRLGGVTQEDEEQAVHWINMAIEKDPDYGIAYAWRACAVSTLEEWTGEDYSDQWLSDSRRALELDDNEAESHRIMGEISLYDRDFEKTEYHFHRALELNPNNSWIVGRMGNFYIFIGDAETALEYQNRATSLDPLLPSYCRELEVVAHYVLGNYKEAVNVASQFLHQSQRSLAYRVAALSHLDDEKALSKAVEELLINSSNFSISNFLKNEFYRNDDIPQQLAEDLKKAGFPETVDT